MMGIVIAGLSGFILGVVLMSFLGKVKGGSAGVEAPPEPLEPVQARPRPLTENEKYLIRLKKEMK